MLLLYLDTRFLDLRTLRGRSMACDGMYRGKQNRDGNIKAKDTSNTVG